MCFKWLVKLYNIFVKGFLRRILHTVFNNSIIFRVRFFILGAIIAFLIWYTIIINIGLQMKVAYIILFILIPALGLASFLYEKVRCITVLTCLGLITRSGRSFLRAMTFSLILSGAFMNLASNGNEVVRVFSCSTILTYNLSRTKFDLMTKPFLNALRGMKENISHVKEIFEESDDIVQTIVNEIDGTDFQLNSRTSYSTNKHDMTNYADYYQKKYLQKLRTRCEFQLRSGQQKCQNAFLRAFEECNQKLPPLVNYLLCWPMKINSICNVQVWRTMDSCDPSKIIDADFGENFIALKAVEAKLKANMTSVKLQSKTVFPAQIKGFVSAKQTGETILNSFAENKHIFNTCIYVTRKVLALVSLKIIIAAISYNNNFLNNIDFDNFYLTSYFEKIDARRKQIGKRSLLPLKKVESCSIVEINSSKKSKLESKAFMVHILKFLVELITGCFFILLDYSITTLLDVVSRNAKIEYTQKGEHRVNIIVNGTGIIAALVHKALKGFNSKTEIVTTLSNELCLPRPSRLSNWYYFKIFLAYSFLVCLIYYDVYILRLRRGVCGYFYPKREKERTLYMYNQLLKRRRSLLLSMHQIIRDEIVKGELKRRYNIFLLLRLKFPKRFSWIRMFTFGRRRCGFCRELEPVKFDEKGPLNFHICKENKCYFVYCEHCWQDVGKICLPCEWRKNSSTI